MRRIYCWKGTQKACAIIIVNKTFDIHCGKLSYPAMTLLQMLFEQFSKFSNKNIILVASSAKVQKRSFMDHSKLQLPKSGTKNFLQLSKHEIEISNMVERRQNNGKFTPSVFIVSKQNTFPLFLLIVGSGNIS